MDTNHNKNRVLGYLSAAPRVSTRSEAELVGPKAHILGVIKSFESLGWEVKPFIVGDRVPSTWIRSGSERRMGGSILRLLVADMTRLLMGFINSRRAYNELGQEVDWVYERLATLQSLGWVFKKRRKLWILETNAPLFVEAKNDRNSIVLNSLARSLEIRAYRNCDVLVCISETLKRIIVEQAGISPEKVVVVPNGVDLSTFDPSLYHPIRLFDGFTIGFVGNLASWQGLGILLDVLSELRKDGLDIYLVLVGDGAKRQELEGKVQQLNLDKNVQFVGFVPQDQVPKYIAGFDIGYSGQTHRTESRMYCSPIKVYEYMAMGKPVIASDYEDTSRVLRDGTGYLFDIGDKSQLKQVIINAYQAQRSLAQMGSKAREEIIKNHSWVARVFKLIEAIERG